MSSPLPIGIVAVSSSCQAERFARGLDIFRDLGAEPLVALDPCRHYGTNEHLFSSDSAEARSRALADLLGNHGLAGVIAARGAYGSMEILESAAALPSSPVPLAGFSDVTALLLALYAKRIAPVIHSITVESAGRSGNEELRCLSVQMLLQSLQDCRNASIQADLEPFSMTSEAVGPVIGGNLSTLTSLLGTPFFPSLDGHILFLEEVGERPFRIHRMLLQLKLSGVLNRLSGVVLGSFSDCTKDTGPTHISVIEDIFASAPYPVYGFIAAGHGLPNFPVPFGVPARVSHSGLEFLEAKPK